jgi:hypothetical protein
MLDWESKSVIWWRKGLQTQKTGLCPYAVRQKALCLGCNKTTSWRVPINRGKLMNIHEGIAHNEIKNCNSSIILKSMVICSKKHVSGKDV